MKEAIGYENDADKDDPLASMIKNFITDIVNASVKSVAHVACIRGDIRYLVDNPLKVTGFGILMSVLLAFADRTASWS